MTDLMAIEDDIPESSRQHLIVKPDPEAPSGVSVVEDFFVGPTAEGFAFDEPCREFEEQ